MGTTKNRAYSFFERVLIYGFAPLVHASARRYQRSSKPRKGDYARIQPKINNARESS